MDTRRGEGSNLSYGDCYRDTNAEGKVDQRDCWTRDTELKE